MSRELLRLLSQDLGDRVGRTFELMEVAEEEIRAAGDSPGTFLALQPPTYMVGLSKDVYRAHCRELLSRRCIGESLEPATDAELLCAMHETSLRAPLNASGMAVTEYLAKQVMGPTIAKGVFGDRASREPYQGAVQEELSRMRRRYRVEGRRAAKAAGPIVRMVEVAA